MNASLLTSIIVDNYNYGHTLADAIDSALQQTYRPVEVIVVDDGSTDDSRDIIARYGDRLIPILKENGGQASAFNAGFAHSRGDIIIFLDADDWLLPDLLDRVVHMYRQRPRLVNVIYRLAIVADNGKHSGRFIPPSHLSLPSETWRGDRFQAVMNSASWAPTSGNAFAAAALRQLLPMPEAPFRLGADYYLCRLSALCGPIASLPTVGGYYRIHARNAYHTGALDLYRLREQIEFVRLAHRHVREAALALGVDAGEHKIVDEIHLAQRLISCKLDRRRHPLPADAPSSLCRRGISAARRRPDLPLRQKAVHALWFAAMAAAPPPLARHLAARFFPDDRRIVNRLLSATFDDKGPGRGIR